MILTTTRNALLAITVTLAVPIAGWPSSVSLTPSKDNSIFANNPSGSNGGGAGIFVGSAGSSQNASPRRGLVAFDIASALPGDATISNVALTMYLGQANQNSGNQTIELHRLNADWGEGVAGNLTTSISGTGNGSDAAPGDATWTQRFYQQLNWTSSGAVGDFVTSTSASATVGIAIDTPFIWLSTPTLVSDVQSWLENPLTNFGWILISQGEPISQSVKAFYSSEAVQKNNVAGDPLPPGWVPTLTVTYTSEVQPTGDYSGNGFVDAADYVDWRKTSGQPAYPAMSGADGDGSAQIGDGDYIYWRERFGSPAPGPVIQANVPEPSAALLCVAASPLVFFIRRR
jgi:hypothetical protein